MALVECSECGRQVSDRTHQCIHCGNPIAAERGQLIPPSLPSDLDIGFSPEYFGLSKAEIKIHVATGEATKDAFKSGSLILYPKGIAIKLSGGKVLLHYGQVVQAETERSDSIHAQDKSPVARGIAGGLLIGGVGAILGVASGFSKKEKHYDSVLKLMVFNPDFNNFTPYWIVFKETASKGIPSIIIDRVKKGAGNTLSGSDTSKKKLPEFEFRFLNKSEDEESKG